MPTAQRTDQREINLAGFKSGSKPRPRPQALAALTLLLLTTLLTLILVRDREFWFSSSMLTALTGGSADIGPTVPDTTAQKQRSGTTARRLRPKEPVGATTAASDSLPTLAPPVTSDRLALPPFQVEVIAHGSRPQSIRTRNPINLDLQHESATAPALAIAGTGAETIVTDAAEQVRLSPETTALVLNPVKPNYPLLARQMKVQGSVVLQARIGKDGNIQSLQVLKGPEILSSAALDAVRQWRFKPQYQAGQAVESDTRITVDFIISTH